MNNNIGQTVEYNANQPLENNNEVYQNNMPQENYTEQTNTNEMINPMNNTITEPTPVENVNINQQISSEEHPKEENIFDKLRVNRDDNQENKFDLKTPDLSSVLAPQSDSVNQTNNYGDKYDLRFAINNFRQAVQNTEKFGFKVSTTENDLGDKYQVIIEIEKK